MKFKNRQLFLTDFHLKTYLREKPLGQIFWDLRLLKCTLMSFLCVKLFLTWPGTLKMYLYIASTCGNVLFVRSEPLRQSKYEKGRP